MATLSLVDENPEDISCICGLVEPELEGILLGYESEDRKEIERELVAECDKQSLLQARAKVFDIAKSKVTRCIVADEAARFFEDAALKDSDGYTALLESYVRQWELIPRRAEHRISHDILEILTFVLGRDSPFPSKLIKETSLGKGSFESGKQDKGDSELIELLEQDIANSGEDASVEVVSDQGKTKVLSVSFPITQPDTERIPLDKKKDSPSETPIEPVVVAADKVSDKEPDTALCEKCGCECHKVLDKGDKKLAPASEAVPAVRVKPSVKEMATQTDDKPVGRLEFEYQSDYLERMCRENKKDSKDLQKWKTVVNDKLKTLTDTRNRE